MQPTPGQTMEAQLDEVRKIATQLADARESVRTLQAKLETAVIDADGAGVPKALIADVAGVARPTIYDWCNPARYRGVSASRHG